MPKQTNKPKAKDDDVKVTPARGKGVIVNDDSIFERTMRERAKQAVKGKKRYPKT
jgi:hypothetical protein